MKQQATHLYVSTGGILHIAGNHEEVVKLVDGMSDTSSIGMDLPTLVKNPSDRASPYYRMNTWVGAMALAQAIIGESHEVEVSEDAMPAPTGHGEGDTGLSVEL